MSTRKLSLVAEDWAVDAEEVDGYRNHSYILPSSRLRSHIRPMRGESLCRIERSCRVAVRKAQLIARYCEETRVIHNIVWRQVL